MAGKKIINIIYKTTNGVMHNTPQKITLAKHYNILLDHVAILNSDLDHYFFWHSAKL